MYCGVIKILTAANCFPFRFTRCTEMKEDVIEVFPAPMPCWYYQKKETV